MPATTTRTTGVRPSHDEEIPAGAGEIEDIAARAQVGYFRGLQLGRPGSATQRACDHGCRDDQYRDGKDGGPQIDRLRYPGRRLWGLQSLLAIPVREECTTVSVIATSKPPPPES